MKKKNIDLLIRQIEDALDNKPISEELMVKDSELGELQTAIMDLKNRLLEYNEYLSQLKIGNLDVKQPAINGPMVTNLREFHDSLKYMIWQVNQVANGDYNQDVGVIKDFSPAFSRIIRQLADSELELKVQASILKDTAELMKSVMNGLNEWILVTSQETGELIFTNESAKKNLYDMDRNICVNEDYIGLIAHVMNYTADGNESFDFEYRLDEYGKVFKVKSYGIQWNGKLSYAHYIEDVTDNKKYQKQIEGYAYKDELTGAYNRRYCLNKFEELINCKDRFSYCMIDLDGLKFANDNFGHAAGDEYLNTVVQQIKSKVRVSDVVCRIGGDEFAVFLLGCDYDNAAHIISTIGDNILKQSKEYPMSVSYGIISIDGDNAKTVGTIMHEADEIMYEQKKKKKANR